MAIGSNGTAGNRLQLTTGLPGSEVFSVFGWGLYRSTANDPSIVAVEDAGHTKGVFLELVAGVLNVSNNGGFGDNAFGSTPTSNQAFFFAITNAGAGSNNRKGYWSYVGDADWQSTTSGNGVGPYTPGEITMLDDSFNEAWDGIVDCVGFCDFVLSSDDLKNIRNFGRNAQRVTGLRLKCFSQLWSLSDLGDESGNNKIWATAGTLQNQPPLPIPFSRPMAQPLIRTQAAVSSPPYPPVQRIARDATLRM